MPANVLIASPMGRTWQDSASSILASRIGGTAPVFRAVRGGIYGLCFGVGEETHGGIQFSHNYIAGTPFRPHVHFCFADSDTPVLGETVIFSMEYSYAAVNARYTTPATVAFDTYLIVADDVTYKTDPYHRIVGMSEIAAPTFKESGIIKGRIFRSGGTSVVEPCLDFWDCHYQQGNFGTFDEYPT